MWLVSLHLGIRRIILMFAVFATFIFIASRFSPVMTIVAIAYFFLYVVIILRALLFFGIYIRRKTFSENRIEYEVRDLIVPFKPSQNLRGIYITRSGVISSRVYLRANKQWAYLDKLRVFLQQRKYLPVKNILLLGGGGGSVAITLSRLYLKAQIDVVEISPLMTRIAKRYFLPLAQNRRHLSWFTETAQKFVKRSGKKYNIVFVDIFEGEKTPKVLASPQFLSFLKKRLTTKAALIINLGIQSQGDMSPFVSHLMRIFKPLQLFIWEKNLIAVWQSPTTKKS